MKRSDILALIAMAGWGISYVPAARLLEDWSIPTAVGARFAFGGLILIGVLIAARRPLRPGVPLRVIAWIALTQTVLFYSAVYWGIEHSGAGISALLSNTDPLFVAILAALFLGDRLAMRQWAGVLIGFGGAGVIVWDGPLWPPQLSSDALVVLGGAFVWSIGTILVARGVRARAEPLAIAAWQMVGGGIGLGAVGLIVGGPATIGGRTIGLALITAIAGAAIPLALFYWALQEAPAGEVSAWFFLVPVVGVLTAWGLLGETPDGALVVGLVTISVGLWLVLGRREARNGGLVESKRSP